MGTDFSALAECFWLVETLPESNDLRLNSSLVRDSTEFSVSYSISKFFGFRAEYRTVFFANFALA